MALGQKLITIDSKTFFRGMSTSDYSDDGGFSSRSTAINLFTTPGVLRAPPLATDKSTGLVGDIIASCEDSTGNYTRVFVSTDAQQDGRFWSCDSTGTLTQRGVEDSGAGKTYIDGKTDMIVYKDTVYITNSTYIVYWSGVGSSNTFNYTLVTFNDTNAAHPALVFEDNAYFGDGNRLLRMTAAGGTVVGGTVTTILTLPTGQKITALGIDPGSGKMLIGTVMQYNVSSTINTAARVLFYDGFSNKASRAIIMDDMVTAFPTTAGDLYVAYGKSLGYWNGSGATFLRRYNVNNDEKQLLYKHRFTSYGQTLFSVEQRSIIAHGPLQIGGPKVFYPIIYNDNNTNIIRFVVYLGYLAQTAGVGIAYAHETEDFYTINLSSTSTSSANTLLYTNKFTFPQFNDGAWIRRIRFTFSEQLSTAGDTQNGGYLYLVDENGIVDTIGNGGLFQLLNNTGAATAVIDVYIGGGTGTRFRQLQIRYAIAGQNTTNIGVQQIDVFGDPANVTNGNI